MEIFIRVVRILSVSAIVVILIKMFVSLRKLLLKTAINVRKKHNKKTGLPPDYGIDQIDENSLSYQIDSIEGSFATAILFLIGLLFVLLSSTKNDMLFFIIAAILVGFMFVGCWTMRNKRTKKYRILLYILCGVSLLLIVHVIISSFIHTTATMNGNNSISVLLYIWSTMLMYKLLVDGK